MQTHDISGDEDELQLRSAVLDTLAIIGDIADQCEIDRSRFGEMMVQALLVTLRVRHPGDEWRSKALETCAHAIDQSDRLQAMRPTHGGVRHAQ